MLPSLSALPLSNQSFFHSAETGATKLWLSHPEAEGWWVAGRGGSSLRSAPLFGLQNMLKPQSVFFLCLFVPAHHQQHQGVSSGVFGEQELLFCSVFPCSAFQLLPDRCVALKSVWRIRAPASCAVVPWDRAASAWPVCFL